VIGRLFSRNRAEATETDIVMTLTPHIVRRTVFTEDDLRSFSLGSEGSPLLFEVPGIPSMLVPPKLQEPPRTEPIRPPSPAPSPSPTPGA
jgi:type II secretory pathway component GspD/PulD (secretin)